MEHCIEIGNYDFLVREGTVQLSLGIHATIFINIDINKHPEYEDIFFKMYQDKEIFNVVAKLFEGRGTRIKSVDIDKTNGQMNLFMRCDVLDSKTIDERRDELLNEVLNIETLSAETNIN